MDDEQIISALAEADQLLTPGHIARRFGELLTLVRMDVAQVLRVLASPRRRAIVARLAQGEVWVSQMARDVGMPRPLLQSHLRVLEGAGLVTWRTEVRERSVAVRVYQLAPVELDGYGWGPTRELITRLEAMGYGPVSEARFPLGRSALLLCGMTEVPAGYPS